MPRYFRNNSGRRMLDFSLGGHGVIFRNLRPTLSHPDHAIAASHFPLDGEGRGENSPSTLAKRCEQRGVLKLGENSRLNGLRFEPLIEDLSQCRVLHRKQKRSARKTGGEAFSIQAGK